MLLTARHEFFGVDRFSQIVSRGTKENRRLVHGDPWKPFLKPHDKLACRLMNELEVDNQPRRSVQLLAQILSSGRQGR